MSHTRTAKLAIKNANLEVCRAAMGILASQYQAQVQTQIRDYYDKVIPVTLGLSNLNYGIVLQDGQLTIIGDSWGKKVKLEDFQKAFEQTYTRVAVAQALRAAGYRVNVQNIEQGILVRGDMA
jgi:hypothetical protein